MKLSKIMSSFHTYDRQWICQFNRNIDILSFGFLSTTANYEPGVLYFGYTKDLPTFIPSYQLTFLCIEDVPCPDLYRQNAISTLNLICFPNTISEMEILKNLTKLFGEAARISAGRSSLVNTLHENLGLISIINTAFDLLQNPIVVVDSSYKILGMSQELSEIDGREDLLQQKNLGFMLQANIDAMKRDRIYEQAREKKYPFYHKNQKKRHGWITSLIYIHGIEVGQLGVMDSRHDFNEVDFELIDFLSKIISLELQKSDFYRENRGMMHSYFLADLLDHQVRDSHTLEQRMLSLNWKLSTNLYLMIISDTGNNFFDGKAQLITSQLHHMLPNSRWVIYQGQIIFLLTLDNKAPTQEITPLEEYLKINQLTAAISNRFEYLLDMRTFYRQAQKALEFGIRFHPNRCFYQYSDYIFYHMGEIVGSKHALKDFYHPSVVAIREYDQLHHTHFLKTLELYLTHIDSPGTIAALLFVHKNTVFYRIAKLKEQFHLQLDNGEERFKIHLTIKLMELE